MHRPTGQRGTPTGVCWEPSRAPPTVEVPRKTETPPLTLQVLNEGVENARRPESGGKRCLLGSDCTSSLLTLGDLTSVRALGYLVGHYAAETGTVKEKLYRSGAVDRLCLGRQAYQLPSDMPWAWKPGTNHISPFQALHYSRIGQGVGWHQLGRNCTAGSEPTNGSAGLAGRRLVAMWELSILLSRSFRRRSSGGTSLHPSFDSSRPPRCPNSACKFRPSSDDDHRHPLPACAWVILRHRLSQEKSVHVRETNERVRKFKRKRDCWAVPCGRQPTGGRDVIGAKASTQSGRTGGILRPSASRLAARSGSRGRGASWIAISTAHDDRRTGGAANHLRRHAAQWRLCGRVLPPSTENK